MNKETIYTICVMIIIAIGLVCLPPFKNKAQSKSIITSSQYRLRCKAVGGFGTPETRRCENKEVVCYIDRRGFQCKFKEVKDND